MSLAPISHHLCLLFVLLFWRFQKGEALLSFHGLQQQPLAANPQKKTNWQTQETKKSVGMKQSPPHRAHRGSGHYHMTIAEDPPVPTGSVATKNKKNKFPSRITTPRASLLAASVGTILLAMSPAPVSFRHFLSFVFLSWTIQKGEALLSLGRHGQPPRLLAANLQKTTNWQETKKSVGLKRSLSRGHRDSGHYHVTIANVPLAGSAKKKFPWRITTPSSRTASLFLAAAGRVGTLAVLLAMSHPQLASAAGATDVRGATTIPEFPRSWKTVAQYVVVLGFSSLVPVGVLIFFVNKSISDAANNTNLKIEGVSKDIGKVKTELKAEIKQVNTELKAGIKQVEMELKGDIKEVKADIKQGETELKGGIKQVETDIKQVRRDIKQVKTVIKQVKTDIKQVKTDIKQVKTDMANLNEKIDGKLDDQDKAIADIQNEVSDHKSEMKNGQARMEIKTEEIPSEPEQQQSEGQTK